MNSFPAAWRNLSTRLLAYGDRLVTALTDHRKGERNAGLLLLAYLAVWTLYAVIEKSSQDINFDMAEIVIWSRELAAGGPKHPQLAAWIAALWFEVFPYTDWAFYLLAIATATAALWIVWRLSKYWLDPDKRAAGLALLTLVPFFNFLAIKYNVNAVLVPFWALTTYCFLLSYSTRNLWFAAIAGAGAAACMLGKYWSIFLIAGLGLAAIIDPRRREYFRSPAPWVTIAVGLLIIAPHLVWLYENHFSAFSYPLQMHGGHSESFSARKVLLYLLGIVAYIALPLLLFALAARPSAAALRGFFWPKEDDRRLAALAFWLPILLPIPVVLLLRSDLTPIWAIPAVSLLPVLLLASKSIVLTRNAVAAIVLCAVALPLAALALSPAFAIANHLRGVNHNSGQYRLLAQEIGKNWRAATDQPLRLLGSAHALADSAAFYLAGRPSTLNIFRPQRTPWVTGERIKRDGIVVFCLKDDQACMERLEAFARAAPESRRTEIAIATRYLGMEDAPISYALVLILPGTLSTIPVTPLS
ncbi:MAG TPA: glycosyltransferase family 39 protein [Xanthobacteraceae bacterium]|nr:glycosyltransferase family 39 protein [Xanthobacteraceae bacterium]